MAKLKDVTITGNMAQELIRLFHDLDALNPDNSVTRGIDRGSVMIGPGRLMYIQGTAKRAIAALQNEVAQ